MALGWLCIGNYALSYLLRGLNDSLLWDLIPMLFGMILLALLKFRYQPYFEMDS